MRFGCSSSGEAAEWNMSTAQRTQTEISLIKVVIVLPI
jgi:hypothetical protein